eukprot:m.352676 g.352676  ORF g.352676 m.352676 type:complete len:386 (-) comp16584_c0_seq1:421-1578(-)
MATSEPVQDAQNPYEKKFSDARFNLSYFSLAGATTPMLLRNLWRYRQQIQWQHNWLKLVAMFLVSIVNTAAWWLDELFTSSSVSMVEVKDPVFVLGAHRSGTTFLHNLMAQDKTLSFASTYQVTFPSSFNVPLPIKYLIPNERPMDKATFGAEAPQEDEYALFTNTGMSWFISMAFDQDHDSYARYLSMDKSVVTQAERQAFMESWMWFLKRITYANECDRLVLKSPPHTSRVPLLLEMFPSSKFVFIHRDPYRMFRSFLHLHDSLIHLLSLAKVPTPKELEQKCIKDLSFMLNTYLRTRQLIPEKNLVEVGFDEVMRNPMDSIKHIYDTLGMDFENVREACEAYVETQKGYTKNSFPTLSKETIQAINQGIGPQYFETFGYTMH